MVIKTNQIDISAYNTLKIRKWCFANLSKRAAKIKSYEIFVKIQTANIWSCKISKRKKITSLNGGWMYYFNGGLEAVQKLGKANFGPF